MVSMRTVAGGASSSAFEDLSQALSVSASDQAEPGQQIFDMYHPNIEARILRPDAEGSGEAL
jgi:hypothetical protein